MIDLNGDIIFLCGIDEVEVEYLKGMFVNKNDEVMLMDDGWLFIFIYFN